MPIRNFIKPKRRTSSASPVQRTPREADSRDTREDVRTQVINKLRSSITGIKERREEESDTSETSDSNEEGEVEDELTNVRYSESDTPTRTPISGPLEARLRGDSSSGPKNQKKGQHSSRREKHSREPKPGPSGARKSRQTATTIKSESKKPKRIISPIKFPDKTPTKSEEEVPLSKLSPRVLTPPPKLDLREELNLRPASSKPKIDGGGGPIKYRISCDFPPRLEMQRQNDTPHIPAFVPWLPGKAPINNQWLPATHNLMKWRTPHSNRPFIARNTTSRNDGTMTGQEEDEVPEEGEDEEENEPHDANGKDSKKN